MIPVAVWLSPVGSGRMHCIPNDIPLIGDENESGRSIFDPSSTDTVYVSESNPASTSIWDIELFKEYDVAFMVSHTLF